MITLSRFCTTDTPDKVAALVKLKRAPVGNPATGGVEATGVGGVDTGVGVTGVGDGVDTGVGVVTGVGDVTGAGDVAGKSDDVEGAAVVLEVEGVLDVVLAVLLSDVTAVAASPDKATTLVLLDPQAAAANTPVPTTILVNTNLFHPKYRGTVIPMT